MTPEVQLYLAVGHTDLRGAFDRLAAITRNLLHMDPNSGALFVFTNRRRNRLKAIWWDANGYVILYKWISANAAREIRSNRSANCVLVGSLVVNRIALRRDGRRNWQ